MIKEFQGEFRWLSNFSPVDVRLYGELYKSVEHAYQSAKSSDPLWKHYCQIETSPGLIKKQSKNINIRSDWHNVKVDIMRQLLIQKFSSDPYMSKLLHTGYEYIQEGNMWNDKFWGVCLKTGEGLNILGKLIMDIRGYIRIASIVK